MRRFICWLFGAGLSLAAPALASAQTAPLPRPVRITPTHGPAIVRAPTAPCDVTSMDSPPAKAWWAAQAWRYPSAADATQAYQALANNGKGGSAWADWYLPAAGLGTATPPVTVLPVGTRFQMAMAPTAKQPDDQPGGWGTFDYIASVEDVREFLAVIHLFKPEVDRVVTFEVTQLLPVLIGPVGPQVDAETCQYYPGRWSQFYMLPAWNQRMNYLKIVEVRPIQ